MRLVLQVVSCKTLLLNLQWELLWERYVIRLQNKRFSWAFFFFHESKTYNATSVLGLVHFDESKMYSTSSVAWFLTVLVLFMVWLHDDELKKWKVFPSLFKKVLHRDNNIVNPRSHGSSENNKKMLCYACQAGNWQCDFVKKHHASAVISTDWTCNIRAHDDASVSTVNNGIIFKNLHFEFHFQKFAFSGPQMPLLGTWTAKTFLVENSVV